MTFPLVFPTVFPVSGIITPPAAAITLSSTAAPVLVTQGVIRTLPYVGAATGNVTDGTAVDVVSEAYVSAGSVGNLTQAQVNSDITSAFGGFVTKASVDATFAPNATKDFVDMADATRLQLANIGALNGVAPLDVNARVSLANIPSAIGSTQRFPAPFISPVAYNASPLTILSTSGTQGLYTCTVADPMLNVAGVPTANSPYRLLVFGTALMDQVGLSTPRTGVFPQIVVNQGSPTGPLVAVGAVSLATSYAAGELTTFSTVGAFSYTLPTWFSNGDQLDVIIVGAGGGGSSSIGNGATSGNGGFAGHVTTKTLIGGNSADIPLPATTVLSGVVGAGGFGGGGSVTGSNNGGAGGSSTVSYGGGPTVLTGSPGGGGSGTNVNQAGGRIAAFTFDNSTYQPAASGFGSGGNGGGASLGSGVAGGSGSHGVVYFFAHPPNDIMVTSAATIAAIPLNAQTTIIGGTTLYVQAVSNGASATVLTTQPSLWVMPIPA
jgi:hypothetical protein